MTEAIGIEVAASQITRHIPNSWKAKIPDQTKAPTSESNMLEADHQPWHEILGRHSGKYTDNMNQV